MVKHLELLRLTSLGTFYCCYGDCFKEVILFVFISTCFLPEMYRFIVSSFYKLTIKVPSPIKLLSIYLVVPIPWLYLLIEVRKKCFSTNTGKILKTEKHIKHYKNTIKKFILLYLLNR